MNETLAQIKNILTEKFISIIEPYRGSNLIIQLIILILIIITSFFFNRFISGIIRKNYNKILKNHAGSVLYEYLSLIYKKLILAVFLSFTVEVFKYVNIPLPVVEQIYIILYLWVAIKVVSKMVKNRILKKTITISAWIIIILNILNLYSDTAILLDTIAVTFSGIRISIYGIIRSIVYFLVIYKLTTVILAFINQRIENAEDINPTIKVLITKVFNVLIFVIATILFINVLGIDLGSLALFTSALGVGIGFGLQKIVANLISGVTLLLDNSLKPGDIVEVQTNMVELK